MSSNCEFCMQHLAMKSWARSAAAGETTCFDTWTAGNRDRIEIRFAHPTILPSVFVLPHIERLLKIGATTATFKSNRLTRNPSSPSSASARATWPASITLTGFISGAIFAIFITRTAEESFFGKLGCTDPERDIGDECFASGRHRTCCARSILICSSWIWAASSWLWPARLPARRCSPARFSRKARPPRRKAHAILDAVRKRFKISTSWFPAAVRYVSQGKSGQNLGGNRQPLPRMRRLHLCLPAAPALPSATVRRARMKSSACASGFVRPRGFTAWPEDTTRARQCMIAATGVFPKTGALFRPTRAFDGLRRLRALRAVCHGDVGDAKRGGDDPQSDGGGG